MVVQESVHVVFEESNESLERKENVDEDVGLGSFMGRLQIDDRVHQQEEKNNSKMEESLLAPPPLLQLKQGESSQGLPKEWKFVTNHPQDQIIGNRSTRVRNRSLICGTIGVLESTIFIS